MIGNLNPNGHAWLRRFLIAALVGIAVPGLYVLSILWRVSAAEQKFFGRSCLVPVQLYTVRHWENAPTSESYGSTTYTYIRDGVPITVHKQLINGFQHTYGSALASLELGDNGADLLFRANEYCEAYLQSDGRTEKHYLDTKKDLANNSVGRKFGEDARALGLRGRQAKKYLIQRTLDAIDKGIVINHYMDPRVRQLPSLEQYGCPGLPNPERTRNGA